MVRPANVEDICHGKRDADYSVPKGPWELGGKHHPQAGGKSEGKAWAMFLLE